jgi:uncharacterized protein (DUF3820 family)
MKRKKFPPGVLPLGKYQGRNVGDVPDYYLFWLAERMREIRFATSNLTLR